MRLTFCGAALMVTGSSYLIETGDTKLLVDCGMFQGAKAVQELNTKPFPYRPHDIDYVLLTHAHIDHSGLLPRLCKQGFQGKIIATKSTVELCGIMLPDSGHIQEMEAEWHNRKGCRAGRPEIQPLYTAQDALAALEFFHAVRYDEPVEISPTVRVRFRDAGHILGSAMIEIWVEEGPDKVKLVFSGDIGQNNQPIIKDPTILDSADYLVMESTYGNRIHEQEDKVAQLKDIVNTTAARGGNVVIPAFAVGRTQTLLYYLHQLTDKKQIPPLPVIIDSPLAISATNIFINNLQDYDQEAYDLCLQGDCPLKFPNLQFARTVEESKAINTLTTPTIIISANGMAEAGRILHHLKHNLWRPESSVLFIGYQAEGTLGRRLLAGAKKVRIMGEEISVRAKVYDIEGFSAHADQAGLLSWLRAIRKPPQTVFIVHGERDMAEPLATKIRSELKLDTYIPTYGEELEFTAGAWHVVGKGVVVQPKVADVLQDMLAAVEGYYRQFRQQLETDIAREPEKASVYQRRLSKLLKYMEKALGGKQGEDR